MVQLADIERTCLEQVITNVEAAKILAVSKKRIRDLCVSGKLIARQAGTIWLISKTSVEQRMAESGKLH